MDAPGLWNKRKDTDRISTLLAPDQLESRLFFVRFVTFVVIL
jgi:hypothetical protein